MLYLHNTLTRRKEEFKPLDEKNVRMYVCGPTVYDRPHLGNARSVVVYDVLYRLLKHIYGEEHVTYVRNITDVDDKINAAAKANNEPISALTSRVEQWFHDDMAALNVLAPTNEPRATSHVNKMIALIEKLIAGDHAYVSQGHVLFAVQSYKDYGALSGRKLAELLAGARVEVESYKKHPGDFVLWKPADALDDASSVFDSPWGRGRPGWHIECSAMSTEYLGENFDIHGGGSDLMFPHHENEIAQSRCALPGSQFARYWVHNGFLTVNGEKMSKSLGNFVTVKDLLDKGRDEIEKKKIGEIIRYVFLSTHYRKPLDWSEKVTEDANYVINRLYAAYYNHEILGKVLEHPDYSLWYGRYDDFVRNGEWKWELSERSQQLFDQFMDALKDDMNTSIALSKLFELTKAKERDGQFYPSDYFSDRVMLKKCCDILGLLQGPNFIRHAFSRGKNDEVESLVNARIAAKRAKNFAEADRIRKELADSGIILEDRPDGTTDWRRA